MREYDDIEYRYKSNDENCETALRFISNTLGFSPDVSQLKFDLSFFSGGIGVFDKIAFSCKVSSEQWESLTRKLELITPQAAVSDEEWGKYFAWLVKYVEPDSIEESCRRFINSEKASFQDACTPDHRVLFMRESNVNTWMAVWGGARDINYLYFDQG